MAPGCNDGSGHKRNPIAGLSAADVSPGGEEEGEEWVLFLLYQMGGGHHGSRLVFRAESL